MMSTSPLEDLYQLTFAEHAKAALVEVVHREPDMTLEDLAGLIATNPGLGGLTLDELLTGLRARQQPCARPPLVMTDQAARRIAGHEADIRGLVEQGLTAARELGLEVRAVRVRARWSADDEGPMDGIFIDFRVQGSPTTRIRFWDRIHEPEFHLPFEVSLIAS
jgi:hypothetical protein